MARPTLIFDFGNVVAFYDYSRFHRALCRVSGITAEELALRLSNNGYLDLHQAFEKGEMEPNAFSAAFRQRYELETTPADFENAWSDIFWLNPPVAVLVGRLKAKGYALVLGSNTNAIHASHFRRQFATTIAQFDQLVLSFDAGCLKPSAEFYLTCARAARSIPSDCIFIDDLPENVEGARQAGLRPIHYTGPATLMAELRRLGINV
jgi:HAD superfamily hydrolase (TIGR01509 family)